MIERTDISGVLSQIRSTQDQLNNGMNPSSSGLQPLVSGLQEGGVNPLAGIDSAESVKEVPSFATMLKQAIDGVNDQQKETSDLRTRYEMGDPDVDIVNVMISSQKSSVAFEAMSQVRTKVVTAYQEIMRMPI